MSHFWTKFTIWRAQKNALLKNALFEEIYIENCDLTKFRTAGRPAVPKLFLYSVCGAYTERSSRFARAIRDSPNLIIIKPPFLKVCFNKIGSTAGPVLRTVRGCREFGSPHSTICSREARRFTAREAHVECKTDTANQTRITHTSSWHMFQRRNLRD